MSCSFRESSMKLDLLIFAAGVQVAVMVVFDVLKTTEVDEIYEVTPFLAATVVGAGAAIVVYKMLVCVTPFGVETFKLVLRTNLVSVSLTDGVAAVKLSRIVEVDLRTVVLPLGVDFDVAIELLMEVTTCETVFGVTVETWISEMTTIWCKVVGEGVMIVVPVIFDVLSRTVVLEAP